MAAISASPLTLTKNALDSLRKLTHHYVVNDTTHELQCFL
jgi:hypothetical protein